MAKGNRVTIGLKCSYCGDINYSTVKNAKTTTEKLELKKFCPRLNKHTIHKEVKLKS
ncbi:50S ribosomal protein L33 [Helicobacter sp. UBA3407]|uniref:50S ribosomal protein L33 n=1 Tax=Helicobacter sp. UBA3407 TaxID=1946588 RepID=UPI00261DC15E|nr:50S ribosomal protein L33 [Helicobacter sp. UBA3407]